MEFKKNKLGGRMWLVIILIGLAGQFAWAIENMYLNSYIEYLNFTAPAGEGFDTNLFIAITNALSAVTATVTTLLMGGLTDKIGRRKGFVAFGYILWGVATASFGLLNVTSSQNLIPIVMAASTAGMFVIIIDCVMTFFGSTSYDAAFNSYITKNVKESKRGKVEGILGIFPLVAMLLIFVGLNGLTTKEAGYRWDLFFYIIGGIVFLIGVISLFLIPKEPKAERKKEKYFSLLFEGFKPSVIKKNKVLYIYLVAYFISCVATQVYFPYLMIYIEKACNISNSGGSLITNFAIVMATALLLGSLFSVLICSRADKKGREKFLIPTLIIQMIGFVLMFFVPYIQDELIRTIYAAGSGLVLILGYVAFPSVLNSLVRTYIPKGKEGSFMGIRMIFVVALPMCVGPFIGSALNNAFGAEYFGTYGEKANLPTNWGYLVALGIMALAFIPVIINIVKTKKEVSLRNNSQLIHVSEEELKNIPEVPFAEYPRPQLVRPLFQILNGEWDFTINKTGELPAVYDKKIIVPYPVESPYSKVGYAPQIDEYLFYHRIIKVKQHHNGYRYLLHFNGVDQFAYVYAYGKLIYEHECGYTKFTVDVTDYIKNGEIDLVVKTLDLHDSSYLMRGKQSTDPHMYIYGTSSGIYKTVWLEEVPAKYIEKIEFSTDFEANKVLVNVITNTKDNQKVTIIIEEETYYIKPNTLTGIEIKNPKLWSFDSPYLYHVEVYYRDDRVSSYFGFRKVEAKMGDEKGIYINNKKVILNGLLDQGYYFPNGLTPKSYKDYEEDILNVKELGFNCLRKHIKVEEDYFYYLCDKFGLMVIQDIPNGGRRYAFWNTVFPRLSIKLFNKEKNINEKKLGNRSAEEKEKFIAEAHEIVKGLSSNPSIVIFTIFNEGWGEFEPNRVYQAVKSGSIINNHIFDVCSGWYLTDCNVLYSIHAYTLQTRKRSDNKFARPYFLSEFGGVGIKIDEHSYYDGVYTHLKAKNLDALNKKYKKLYSKLITNAKKGIGDGFIYTQLTDTEIEYNGIYTFDRELKLDKKMVQDLNHEINELFTTKE